MQYEKEQLLSITRAGKVCALCGQSLDARKHLSMLAPREALLEAQTAAPAPAPEGEDGTEASSDANATPGTDAETTARGAETAPETETTAEAEPVAPPATAPAKDRKPPQGSDDDEAALVRTDYHQECWQQVAKSDYLSFWLARRPKPPETPKMSKKERNVALLGLFSALMKSQDPIDDPSKFVLSHLLMKYRALLLGRSRLDDRGRKWIVFILPQTDEEFEIPDLQLSDDQVAQTLARISDFLETAQTETTIVATESDSGHNAEDV